MKKYISLVLLTAMMLILAACSTQYSDNIRINLKNDKSSNFGYAAAVYEDRIYYISNELGTAGIYSMNLDGSEIKVEVENPSITSLEVREGILYFNGLFKIKKRQGSIQTSTINNHTVYYCAFGEKVKKADYINPNFNINGFFVSEEGYIAARYGATLEDLHLFSPSYLETFSDIDNIIATISFEYYDEMYVEYGDEDDKKREVQKNIYQFGDLLIIAEHIPEGKELNRFTNEDPYVLDSNTGDLVLVYSDKQADALKAFYMDENNIYCSYKEMVVVLDRATYQTKTTFVPEGLSKEFQIVDIMKYADDLYIIADKWRCFDEKTLPLLGEKLLLIDSGTFMISEVLELGLKQRIIGLDENYIILLEDEVIYEVSLDDGKIGDKTIVSDAPLDICSKNHIIDYAGDWMFIYKSYPENGAFTYGSEAPGQRLLMKVNLESGEIIENNVVLDFEAHGKYEEK